MSDLVVRRTRDTNANNVNATNNLLPTPRDTAESLQVPGRSVSTSSTKVDGLVSPGPAPSRVGTLRKRSSVRKQNSLSRRGSLKSLRTANRVDARFDEDAFNSVYNCPVPTHGNPTEVLAERFNAWRKLLKDLIAYFREIQATYEQRSKALIKVSNVVNNTRTPEVFLARDGLDEALTTLRNFHKLAITEANKARDIEDDVVVQLNGLRSDLQQKIKEIKSLAGDFKNSVEKERDSTRRAVEQLRDALAAAESDPAGASDRPDPFLLRQAVEKQVEKQIEEENYLHRAYLNLEGSGRELESIVVGEIQKAYNALVGILRRESEAAQETIEELRSGPIALPKDFEWRGFVEKDSQFIDPDVPLRKFQDMLYPGKYSAAATEIRAGMLERKSKYLKSYTPGWYVLSATHLHEYKSADHIHAQQPVMSLLLRDQKLGSRSGPDASSHKFSLKGRQAGGALHRGHAWVFRAESQETMTAWYADLQILTEKPSAERAAFVRRHASVAGAHSRAASVSSDGLDDDGDEAGVPPGVVSPGLASGLASPAAAATRSPSSAARRPEPAATPGAPLPLVAAARLPPPRPVSSQAQTPATALASPPAAAQPPVPAQTSYLRQASYSSAASSQPTATTANTAATTATAATATTAATPPLLAAAQPPAAPPAKSPASTSATDPLYGARQPALPVIDGSYAHEHEAVPPVQAKAGPAAPADAKPLTLSASMPPPAQPSGLAGLPANGTARPAGPSGATAPALARNLTAASALSAASHVHVPGEFPLTPAAV